MDTKKIIVEKVVDLLESKISELKQAIKNVQAAVNEETKSSMGDKYEVGRVMAQNEREMLEVQLGEHEREMDIMNNINYFQDFEEVRLGALVETNIGKFLMGVSLGKIKSDMGDIMLISPNSPIGMLFMGKKTGDLVIHNNKEVRILSLI